MAKRLAITIAKQRAKTVCSNSEMEQVWRSLQMTYKSAMGQRNSAIVGLMLDTDIRHAEPTNLTIEDMELQYQRRSAGNGSGTFQYRVQVWHRPVAMASIVYYEL